MSDLAESRLVKACALDAVDLDVMISECFERLYQGAPGVFKIIAGP